MPPAVALITVMLLEIRKLATPAPRMAISSWGAASMITPMLPPDMMKLPNTRPKSSTTPIIWNMVAGVRGKGTPHLRR